MKTLNPFGCKKTISNEVIRDIKSFELNFLDRVFCKPENVTKIYESENSNWNMFLIKNEYFVSIPKNEDTGCKPSINGSVKYTLDYHIFKNL